MFDQISRWQGQDLEHNYSAMRRYPFAWRQTGVDREVVAQDYTKRDLRTRRG